MNKNMRPKYVIVVFWVLLSASIVCLLISGLYLIPYLMQAVEEYQSFLNLYWAHQSHLVEMLLNLILASWALGSAIFFNGWLIHRITRKLQGKSWMVLNKKNKKVFFPAISSYLKISTAFLIAGWLFVVAQYPLQFM